MLLWKRLRTSKAALKDPAKKQKIMEQKVIFLLFGLLLFSSRSFAQNQGHLYYAEIYETSVAIVGKSVSVNFGLDAPSGTGYKLSDESEEHVIEFKNAIAALNYLSAQGWRLVSVYERETSKTNRRTFYLMEFDSSKYEKTALIKAIDKTIQEYLE